MRERETHEIEWVSNKEREIAAKTEFTFANGEIRTQRRKKGGKTEMDPNYIEKERKQTVPMATTNLLLRERLRGNRPAANPSFLETIPSPLQ